MTRQTSALIVGFSLMTLAVLGFRLSQAAPKSGVVRHSQNQDRSVRDVTVKDCPVQIRVITTKKRTIKTNEEFQDDDDWLKGLSLRVTNRSDKTVTYVGIHLIFRKTKEQTPSIPADFSLTYGFDPLWLEPGEPIPEPTVAPIAPGTEADIVLSDYWNDELKTFLARAGFFPNHKTLELDITVVGFSDETMWNLRHWLRRDPTQLQKPLPGWRRLEDPSPQATPTKSQRAVHQIALLFLCWPVFARLRE